jgi:SsrA-binding protein
MRSRKLLLHREQIRKLQERMAKERLTLVPLSMLLKNGRVKVELALAKGRQKEDRRQAIAEKESKLEMRREAGRIRKGSSPLPGKQSGARSGSRSRQRDSDD